MMYRALVVVRGRDQRYATCYDTICNFEAPRECAKRALFDAFGVTPLFKLKFLGVRRCVELDTIWYLFVCRTWRGTLHGVVEWLSANALWHRQRRTELDAVTLDRLTPTQKQILDACVEYEHEDKVADSQLAARLSLTYDQFHRALKPIALVVHPANPSRRVLARWWREKRDGFTAEAFR
jgi:hypothetical protein